MAKGRAARGRGTGRRASAVSYRCTRRAHWGEPAAARCRPASSPPDHNDECVHVVAMDSRSVLDEHNTVVSSVGPRPAPHDHALYRAAAGLSSSRDATAVLRQVVQAARALTNADGVAILLYDRESALFVPTVPSVAPGLDEPRLHRQ